jgi:histidinol dehydrogenase
VRSLPRFRKWLPLPTIKGPAQAARYWIPGPQAPTDEDEQPVESLQVRVIDARDQEVEGALHELRERLSPRGDVVSEEGRRRTQEVFGAPLTPQQVVERICGEVREFGLEAVLRYTRQLDRAELTAESLRVPAEEMARAHAEADREFLETVRHIRRQVEEFQRAILHADRELRRANGTLLRQRYVPLERIGICVPGGAAAYPSTLLMTAVPAQVAGVAQIAVVAPPTAFGANNPDLLAVCGELGISEVYRIGGAQAVAALAYGVEGLPKVDKIVGPGNLFVALAKKYVYGEVDIDSIAGPSEVVVVADDSARPSFIAAELLAQAEHAPGASILVTWSAALLEGVQRELERQVQLLSREQLTVQSLADFGALILVSDAEQGCWIANQLAPEHLHLAVERPEDLVSRIPHAGAVFVGDYSPVALGDYVAGPSHVLPTSGTARWASGLTANAFLRSGSVVWYSPEGLRADAVHVRRMADKEGLTAHKASVEIRLAELPE